MKRSRALAAAVIAGVAVLLLFVAIGDRSTVALALAALLGIAFGAGFYAAATRRT